MTCSHFGESPHPIDCSAADEEMVDCPVCYRLLPMAGPGGWVRHLLAVHPESYQSRAIFTRLVEVQLLDAETAAEVGP